MAGGIFVSYRRDDSRDIAGRLVDRLRQAFDVKDLFLDIETIAPGARFDDVLSDRVGRCAVMLVIIGPSWTWMKDKDGNRRLDNPQDYVRREVAAALARGVQVIPVLVSGAGLPDAAELPDDLKGLVMRQKVDLRFEHFSADADELVASLAGVVPKKTSPLRTAALFIVPAIFAVIGIAIVLMNKPDASVGHAPVAPPASQGASAGATKAVELCTEASAVTGTLVSTTDADAWKKAAARFWELYYGPLYTVEIAQKERANTGSSELETAMVRFGREIPQDAPPGKLPRLDLQVVSLDVAKACKEVLDFYGR